MEQFVAKEPLTNRSTVSQRVGTTFPGNVNLRIAAAYGLWRGNVLSGLCSATKSGLVQWPACLYFLPVTMHGYPQDYLRKSHYTKECLSRN